MQTDKYYLPNKLLCVETQKGMWLVNAVEHILQI